MHKLLLTFLIVLTNFLAFAQGGLKTPEQLERSMARASFREKFEAGNELYYQKNYFYALLLFKNIIKDQPDNAHINYKLGVCYLKSNTERTKALSYLKKAEKAISRNFDTYSSTDNTAPNEFDKSIEYFNKFKSKVSKKHQLVSDAELQMEQCIVAKSMLQNSRTDVVISNLGSNINSAYSDFSPVVSLDDRVLYFTSRRVRKDSSNIDEFVPDDGKHFEDIYVSYKDKNDVWGEPEILSFSQVDRNEATIGVSADGVEIFAYIDDEGDGNIYSSVFLDTNFSELKKIGEDVSDINTDYWETHASVTPDGNTLYFVSDRKKGEGKRDIYFSKKLPNGEWGLAQNIGATINTPYDEDSPYIAADGKTLYFSTNGTKSMGGFDVFVTRKDENNVWSEPVNMGYPINTVDDDVFFIVNAEGNKGYYSSLRIEKTENVDHGKTKGFGEKDLYEVTFAGEQLDSVAIFKGKIIPKLGQPVPSTMEIFATDLNTGDIMGPFRPRQDDGGYVMALKPCHDYLIEYMLDDELFTKSEFTVPCEADFQSIHTEIYLDPTELDTTKNQFSADDLVRWKIIDAPLDLRGKSVNYYDENGEPLGVVVINNDYIFEYPNNNHSHTFDFDIEGTPNIMCESACIALIDSTDNILAYALRSSDCSFKSEKVVKKWQLLDKDGNIVSAKETTIIFKDKDGNITFEEKVSCNNMFAYHPLDVNNGDYAEISAPDVGLCSDLEMVLLDEANNIIGRTTRDSNCKFTYEDKTVPCDMTTVSYEKHYDYNKRGIKSEEKRFNALIDGLIDYIKCNGTVGVKIESSASKVPTTTFKSNQALAKYRAEDAKDKIIEAITARGIDKSKVKFISINAKVLGEVSIC